MAASGSRCVDSDVHITFEDQQKINKFARTNAKMEDCKEELKNKENELKNMEDAEAELLMQDEETVAYLIGDVFFHQSIDGTQEELEKAKDQLQDDIKNLNVKVEDMKKILTDLKTNLYAKFGTNINLEADED